jgi:inosose dehydratase
VTAARVAFNPLTWYLSPAGQFDPDAAPPLPEIYRQIHDAGFDAVHVEIPDAMPVRDYRALLDDVGLTPAPGYFQAPFFDDEALAASTETARRVAGEHAALGLNRIFIAEQFGVAPQRLEQPGIGAGFDPDRLKTIVSNLDVVCRAMVAEGVTPCLHQHIGTWIETEAETSAVLDGIDPGILLFGPDTGHLSWAGIDPAAYIEAHLDRVGAVHLKDLHAPVMQRARAGDLHYQPAMAAHVWTEPGRGDVDFGAVLAVLSRFEGWYVVEVDVADQPTPARSAEVSASWVREALG